MASDKIAAGWIPVYSIATAELLGDDMPRPGHDTHLCQIVAYIHVDDVRRALSPKGPDDLACTGEHPNCGTGDLYFDDGERWRKMPEVPET